MKRTLFANLRQSMLHRGFLLAVIGAVLAILLASLESILNAFRSAELLPYGFHAQLILNALPAQAMALSLPLLCALPYTTAFLDDIKNGFIKAYLPRTTVLRYLSGKSLACAVSGGLAPVLGILIAYVSSALLFLPMEASLLRDAKAPAYGAELVASLFLFFCSGAFWSMVGLACATLTNSRYMAYASPFIVFYLLVILYERYFNNLYVLYPREWLQPSAQWVFGKYGASLLIFELTVITALAFCAAARRRILST